MLVLGVGQKKDIVNKVTGKETDKTASSTAQSGEATKTVTIAATPSEAEKIALSEEEGILRLTLRPVGDETTIESNETTKSDLISDAKKIIVNR
jgi:Flp pilus assembly protein CpaB